MRTITPYLARAVLDASSKERGTGQRVWCANCCRALLLPTQGLNAVDRESGVQTVIKPHCLQHWDSKQCTETCSMQTMVCRPFDKFRSKVGRNGRPREVVKPTQATDHQVLKQVGNLTRWLPKIDRRTSSRSTPQPCQHEHQSDTPLGSAHRRAQVMHGCRSSKPGQIKPPT